MKMAELQQLGIWWRKNQSSVQEELEILQMRQSFQRKDDSLKNKDQWMTAGLNLWTPLENYVFQIAYCCVLTALTKSTVSCSVQTMEKKILLCHKNAPLDFNGLYEMICLYAVSGSGLFICKLCDKTAQSIVGQNGKKSMHVVEHLGIFTCYFWHIKCVSSMLYTKLIQILELFLIWICVK